jgi:predicted Fe-S protein YdhL (DUF1289 family)
MQYYINQTYELRKEPVPQDPLEILREVCYAVLLGRFFDHKIDNLAHEVLGSMRNADEIHDFMESLSDMERREVEAALKQRAGQGPSEEEVMLSRFKELIEK